MISNSLNNKKSVLVVSDIFGISDAFLLLLEDINVSKQAFVVSPYQQPQTFFQNEQQAYQCFKDNGGMHNYIKNLTEVLLANTGIKQIIGFSAGAAAIYNVMSNLELKNIQLTLFYPAQIRHFVDKYPSSPCHIIFPESEPHFSLPDIVKTLKLYSQLTIEQNFYQHGFMNKGSKAFNKQAYSHYCQMLRKQLSKY
jgi:hypothetical protein